MEKHKQLTEEVAKLIIEHGTERATKYLNSEVKRQQISISDHFDIATDAVKVAMRMEEI